MTNFSPHHACNVMAVRIMIAMPLVMAIVFSNGEVCTETSTNLDDAWTMCPITHEVQSEKHHTAHLGDEDPECVHPWNLLLLLILNPFLQ